MSNEISPKIYLIDWVPLIVAMWTILTIALLGLGYIYKTDQLHDRDLEAIERGYADYIYHSDGTRYFEWR